MHRSREKFICIDLWQIRESRQDLSQVGHKASAASIRGGKVPPPPRPEVTDASDAQTRGQYVPLEVLEAGLVIDCEHFKRVRVCRGLQFRLTGQSDMCRSTSFWDAAALTKLSCPDTPLCWILYSLRPWPGSCDTHQRGRANPVKQIQRPPSKWKAKDSTKPAPSNAVEQGQGGAVSTCRGIR